MVLISYQYTYLQRNARIFSLSRSKWEIIIGTYWIIVANFCDQITLFLQLVFAISLKILNISKRIDDRENRTFVEFKIRKWIWGTVIRHTLYKKFMPTKNAQEKGLLLLCFVPVDLHSFISNWPTSNYD